MGVSCASVHERGPAFQSCTYVLEVEEGVSRGQRGAMQRARVHVHQPLCLPAILCNVRTGTKCYKQKAQTREEKREERRKKS